MHITIGAIQTGRHFQHGDKLCRFKMPAAAGLDLAVGGFAQHHRHPADLQFRTGAHQQLRAACLGDQAGTRLHLVRVLQRAGGGIDACLIARELLRERSPFRFAGEHVECSVDIAAQQQQ